MTAKARFPAGKLASGESRRVHVGRVAVCVVRIGDDFYAIGDRCSHAEVPLSEGDIDVDERTVECWKHGSAFSLLDGQPQSLPAIQPVPVYAVTREGDDVVVTSRE